MESESRIPGHIVTPGGAIYAVVSKVQKRNNNNNKQSNSKDSIVDGVLEAKLNQLENDGKAPNTAARDCGDHRNYFQSSGIYEALDDFDQSGPSASRGRDGEVKMSSEEEAKLHDLLTDLLGMADDVICRVPATDTGRGGGGGGEKERASNREGSKFHHRLPPPSGDVTFDRLIASSFDSGFYQQLPTGNESTLPLPPLSPPPPLYTPNLNACSGVFFNLETPSPSASDRKSKVRLQKSRDSQIGSVERCRDSKRENVYSLAATTRNAIHVVVREEEVTSFVKIDNNNNNNDDNSSSNKHYSLTGTAHTLVHNNNNHNSNNCNNDNDVDRSSADHINPSKYQMKFSTLPVRLGLTSFQQRDAPTTTTTATTRTPYYDFDLESSISSRMNDSTSSRGLAGQSPATPPRPFERNETHPPASNLDWYFDDRAFTAAAAAYADDDAEFDAADDSINSLLDVSTPCAERLAIGLALSHDWIAMEEHRKRRKGKGGGGGRGGDGKRVELVTLEPIGVGMQVLETGRPMAALEPGNFDHRHHHHRPTSNYRTVDHVHDCPDFSGRANDQTPNVARRHAPLIKSISSGYHGQRSEDSFDDPLLSPSPAPPHPPPHPPPPHHHHHHPQHHHHSLQQDGNQKKDRMFQQQQQQLDPPSCRRPQNYECQSDGFTPATNLYGTTRFRQNTTENNNNNNSNAKLPQRFKQKLNNHTGASHHSDNINDIDYYYHRYNNNDDDDSRSSRNKNNKHNEYFTENYTIDVGTQRRAMGDSPPPTPLARQSSASRSLRYPRSPLSDWHRFSQSAYDNFRQVGHRRELSGEWQKEKEEEEEEAEGLGSALFSTMPRRMKLLTPKYHHHHHRHRHHHQISEPELYRSLPFDSSTSPLDVVTTPCFVTDQSKRWFYPNMSREQATDLLVDRPPGSFIVRSSSSFEAAYGLVVKVDRLTNRMATPCPKELVRHFLIDTTPSGVRIRGSPIEPTFGSLSALVYQHMLTPLALPCTLQLGRFDDTLDDEDAIGRRVAFVRTTEETFYYVNGVNTEGLTGQVAMEKAMNKTFNSVCLSEFKVTKVKLRLDQEGITLTDLERRLFFRKKYQWDCVSRGGIDNSPKVYFARGEGGLKVILGGLFFVVTRATHLASENTCHILAAIKSQDRSFVGLIEAIDGRINGNPR